MNRTNWFCLVWVDNQRHFSLLKVPENVTDGPYKRWPNSTHQKKKEYNLIYKISKDYQCAISVPCIFLTFPQVFRQTLAYVVLFIQITVSLHNQGVSCMNKSICCFFFTACCSSAQVHVSRMIHLLLFSTCLMLSWVKQSPLWAAETSLSPESGASRAPPAASTWANGWAALEQHPTTWGKFFHHIFPPVSCWGEENERVGHLASSQGLNFTLLQQAADLSSFKLQEIIWACVPRQDATTPHWTSCHSSTDPSR